MPISVVCPGCNKRFKAPDKAAGRRLPCPDCKTAIPVGGTTAIQAKPTAQLTPALTPKPKVDDDFWDDLGLGDTVPATSLPIRTQTPPTASAPSSQPLPPQLISKPVAAPSKQPQALAPVDPSRQTGLLRHLHWWLAIAMLPLAISMFMPNETQEELVQRVEESLMELSDDGDADSLSTDGEVATETSGAPASSNTTDDYTYEESSGEADSVGDGEFIFQMLPAHKLKGAFLARDTYLHWLFAVMSAGCFFTLFVSLATNNAAKPLHLLGLGLFTATAGVLLLLGLQTLAMSGAGRIRIRGIVGLVFLLFLLIGLSYRMALDPEMGVIPSFLGFTAGVGFCEEFVKALPLMIYFRINSKLSWRGAFLWGLASGAGFGIAEGIMYSQDMYNGISGPMIYFVRFISCVALHAIWTGAVGISIQQRQDLLQEDYDSEDWWMFLIVSPRLIAIPMVLHGLYDTLLKKDMELFALVTAFASFGYLAWLVGRLRSDDETVSRAKFVAEFVRQRQGKRGRA